MAGKHYGGFLVFNAATPTTGGFWPRLNSCFKDGWSQGADIYTAGTPERQAWLNGNAQLGVNPPTGQPAGLRWETAPIPS